MRTLFILLALTASLFNAAAALAKGGIKGKITDEKTGEELPFVSVELYKGNALLEKKQTDLDGNYHYDSLEAGSYSLIIKIVSYNPKRIEGILVEKHKIQVCNVKLQPSSVDLKQVEIVQFKKPLFEKDQTASVHTVTREQAVRAPVKGVNSAGATSSGTYSSPNGVKIRGSRSNGTVYYIDGIKVIGTTANPSPKMAEPVMEKEEMPVFQGGTPAEFKDKIKGGYTDSVNPSAEFNTEEYGTLVENNWKNVRDEPLSTFSIDVDAASYSNIRRFLTNGQMPPKDAVRIEEMINYFHYEYPQPEGDKPFAVITEVAKCPWNNAHQLVSIGLQGKIIPTDNLPASNIVFLIDVSGSMSDYNKLPLVKSTLKLLTEKLRNVDKVAIVVYAGNAGLVLPSTSGADKQAIIAALDRLESGGSTAGGAGIQLAYKVAKENFIKGGNNRVILCTDGDFNVGASSDGDLVSMIEEKRKDNIYLTVLGYGMGNYKDSKMEQLADKGNGNHAYIDNLMEAKKVLVNEFAGTLFAIAKDVKLQLEWNPANIKGYRLIGYENRLLNKEDFNDDTKDAGELGSGHTVTALYEVIPAGAKEGAGAPVDPLRYQQAGVESPGGSTYKDELLTVKLRYKKPDTDKSILVQQPLKNSEKEFDKASENMRWASTVAEFGMLLRNSKFKGNGTYDTVSSWAKAAKGADDLGYRAEFIRLVDMAATFSKVSVNK